jgi:hypothetical protein
MRFVGQNLLRCLGDTLSASIKTPCGEHNLNGKDQQTLVNDEVQYINIVLLITSEVSI